MRALSAAAIVEAESAVTRPYTVPPSAPTVPPAAAAPRPVMMTSAQSVAASRPPPTQPLPAAAAR
ncbi:MAG: hypothetical protein DME13_18260 [Candidatus Rokuibacteriota bacterium]|nr:MAG: hypothetical protein DME13_18260 [Candidatus Rokubacteria bacterium]